MEAPERKRDIATIEYVQPKTKSLSFTSKVLNVVLHNQILFFNNGIFVVITPDNSFQCLSVAMKQRNNTNVISSAIFTTDPDSVSESIANVLIKSLKSSVPIYVSFNTIMETIGLKDVISSLITFFQSHSELIPKHTSD